MSKVKYDRYDEKVRRSWGEALEGPRATRREELSQVIELVNLVFRVSAKKPSTMHLEFPLLFSESNLENMRIIVEDGKPISHVAIYETNVSLYGCQISVGLIGAVCTHPDYRVKGLATATLEDAFEKMRGDGVTLVLISGVRGLYDRLGCAVVGRVHRFTMQPKDVELIPIQGFELKPFEDTDILDVIRVQQAEPVRFHRRIEEFKAFLKCLGSDSAGEVHSKYTFTVSDGVQPLAYIVAQIPRDASKTDSTVFEYGGSRTALAAALKILTQRYGMKGLQIPIPSHDFEFLSILRKAGLTLPKTTHFGGTVKVLGFRNLLTQLRPFLVERLNLEEGESVGIWEEDGRFIFKLGRERLLLNDEKDVTRLLFGVPESVSPRHEKYVPKTSVTLVEGRLTDVLGRVFPLPTIIYGLNYT